LLPADPTHKLDPVKVKPGEPRPLTNDQVEPILTVIPRDQKRNKLLFTLLAETGLRVGERLKLLASDMRVDDMEGGNIRVIGKGYQERVVPLLDAPRTVRLLREALKAAGVGPLFRGHPRKGVQASQWITQPCSITSSSMSS
jgi:integrase/recombinase XerD